MVVPIDADVADAALAALGLSAVAAWMALTWRGRLRPGERVLVLGAGGAVGPGRRRRGPGARRRPGGRRLPVRGGAGAGPPGRRRRGASRSTGDVDALAAAFADALGGAVDVVVDPVFGDRGDRGLAGARRARRLVNLGGASGDVAEFSSAALRSRSAEVLGYTNNALTPAQRRAR